MQGKFKSLRWRHNELDSVSNHQPHDCLLNRLFRRRSMKTSKLRVTGLCAGNSAGTGEFSAQMASNAENVSIWWRHHVLACREDGPERMLSITAKPHFLWKCNSFQILLNYKRRFPGNDHNWVKDVNLHRYRNSRQDQFATMACDSLHSAETDWITDKTMNQ